MTSKRIKRTVGDVVSLTLSDETTAYGRVLTSPLMAFYDLNSDSPLSATEVVRAPIAFKVWVTNYAITDGLWHVIGHAPLEEELREEPLFFKRDALTKALSIYRDSTGEERPATVAECEGLECAAVWEPEHVADRLADHFAGRPNKWVESMSCGVQEAED
ncbi:MAG: Imm26 family immunity protein [Planctomycetota bacterium]